MSSNGVVQQNNRLLAILERTEKATAIVLSRNLLEKGKREKELSKKSL